MRRYHQKLPGASPEREALRQKGQFWTPDWVAEAMVTYALASGSDHVFDPAVGAGAFLRAAKTVAAENGSSLMLLGSEIDRDALREARANGLSEEDLARVQIRDFVLEPLPRRYQAIVGNPPYIRHHRLSNQVKAELKHLGARLLGTPLDGRSGLHVYFLLRALELLATDGRLAFIMPADTCEGIFSSTLWDWVTSKYRLEAVVTFAPEASPFPGVDTNPVIFLIKNSTPVPHFFWAKCLRPQTKQLKTWIASDFETNGESLSVCRRSIREGLATGLSRAPIVDEHIGPTLADFAKVMRGIATGANEFFFLTVERANELEIPSEFLLPAIGRTRDVSSDLIGREVLINLDKRGRPTLLFSPDGRTLDSFPQSVRDYLKHGESLGLHHKTLIATRRPWYKMEVRPAPPILFAYLGRRNVRFILNNAGVVPLTGFLCVYSRQRDASFVNGLWEVLRHPETIANLSRVGKSYGGGAIKVEPRALERLPLPLHVVLQSGLLYEPALKTRNTKQRPVQPSLPLV